MEASRAATGILDVLATKVVRFMMPTSLPLTFIVISGKSAKTCICICVYKNGYTVHILILTFVYLYIPIYSSILINTHVIHSCICIHHKIKLYTKHVYIYIYTPYTSTVYIYVPYLRHLVTALATAHIYNTVRVGVLGQGLGDHSLAATKGSGYSTGTTYIGVYMYKMCMRMSIYV